MSVLLQGNRQRERAIQGVLEEISQIRTDAEAQINDRYVKMQKLMNADGSVKKKAKTGRRPVKKVKAKLKKKVKSKRAKNKLSLGEAVLKTLALSKTTWKKYNEKLPSKPTGLKVVEAMRIIEGEKIWKSNSSSMSNQLHQAFKKLKDEGKITRSEDGRYSKAA